MAPSLNYLNSKPISLVTTFASSRNCFKYGDNKWLATDVVVALTIAISVVQGDEKPIRVLKIGICCLIYTQTTKHACFSIMKSNF